jgi:8-oxo-dGTP pyrophosphatase MutT (NUDIX family)
MATNNLTGCGALIFCTKSKRYLFLLRNNGKYADNWGLVGGKIEPNESILSGLEREMVEELGGKILGAKILPIEKYTSDNEKFIYHTFLIKVEEEFIPELNSEHKGYCWVPLEDYPKPLHPGILRILHSETVRQKLETHQSIKD